MGGLIGRPIYQIMLDTELFDVVALGSVTHELLAWVDRYPGASDGIHTNKLLWTGGGMSGNLVHAVARLGGRAALISATGDDVVGDKIVGQLHNAGVNTDYLLRRSNTTSQVTVLMVTPDLKRAGLVINLPPQLQITSDEVSDSLLQSARVFFTDMEPAEAAINVAQRAKAFGCPVAYDLQMAPERVNLPGHAKNIRRMLATTDYLFADEENFLLWSNCSDISKAIANVLAEYPYITMLITRGSTGSVLATKMDRITIPALPIKIVDTIGAGDAYHGTFLYTHIGLEWPLRKASLFGSAAAALSCTQAGAREGLPTMDDIVSFLQSLDHN